MSAFVLEGLAGVCLIAAVIFIVKFYIDNNKSKNEKQNMKKAEITIEQGKNPAFSAKSKKDLIIAFILMAFCEALILIGKHV